MKRKLLFAMLCIVSVLGMRAQTDVTSTYITNAGFEGDYTRFLDINTDRGIEKPKGWSIQWDQSGKGQNGMTFVAESMTQDSKTWNAKSGKAYFSRMRWESATLYLRQTMQNLRPGSYTLSFSAAAFGTNASAGSVSVSVAGQTQDIAVGTTDPAEWTDYNINFDVTASTPYATIVFTAARTSDNFKFGIDEFKLTYDGSSYYETILTAAQALYDNNKDWAENGLTDFQTAINDNKNKETVAEKNAAIIALETAMQTYKDANSTDVTVKISNPNFDSDISGWTTEGGDGNNFQRQTSTQTNFNGGFLEKWRDANIGRNNQKDFNVYQTLSDLPNGEYTVKAAILAQMQGQKGVFNSNTSGYEGRQHGGPYYIDDKKGVWMYASSGETSSSTWANSFTNTFGEDGGGVYRTATISVSNGSLTIGFKGIGSPNGGTELGTYANWIGCDNWTLSYFGFDPTTMLTQISSLQTQATNLLSNADYTNVVGTERTTLTSASTMTPEDEKKSTLEAAISTIEGAISAFTAAKTNYDALVAEIAKAKALGIATATADGYAATSESTAATALTSCQNLKVAEYTYVTTNYQYGVALGEWTSTATNTSAATFSNEHWSGETREYKNQNDNNGQGWNANSWSINFSQDVTLPAGDYVFKVAGRQASDEHVTTSLVVKNGETTLGSISDFPRSNNTRGINKSGETDFEGENSEFANNGNGFGWEWRYVKFTLSEDATVNIAINSVATASHCWVSFGDYTLQTNDNANISLIAYNIALASANTVIADGAYANVGGTERTALQTAIEADASLDKTTATTIDAATTALKNATSTFIAATTNYDNLVTAISNAQAIVDAGTNVGDDAFQIPTSAQTTLSDAITTATDVKDNAETTAETAGTAATTLNTAITTYNSTALNAPEADKLYNVVNVTEGFTYKDKALTFKSASDADLSANTTTMGWSEAAGSIYPQGVKFTAVEGTTNGYKMSYTRADGNTVYVSTGSGSGLGSNANQIRPTTDASKALTVTVVSAGDKVWKLYNTEASANIGSNGDTGFYTNGGSNSDVLIQEAVNNEISLSITSTNQYGTVIVPFAVAVPEGVTAYSVSETSGNTLTLVQATAIAANTPYILYAENGSTATLSGIGAAYTDASYTAGLLTGVYTSTTATAGTYVLQNHTDEGVGFYKVEGVVPTVGANRAYLTVPASGVKAYFFDTQTGLKSIEAEGNEDAVIYNLAGQRVSKAQKGIYIINGKKIAVK